jgi:glycosyltransferase involved in cell wall biosynthesis
MQTVRRINVLFMQTQTYFGADSMIHSLIMGHLDRSRVTVHVACNEGTPSIPSPALKVLLGIPNLHVLPVDFGPSVKAQTARSVFQQAVRHGGPLLTSLIRLSQYARRNGIDIVHGTEKPRDAFYGLLIARLSGAKAVTHIHAPVGDWMSPLTRWSMRRDDALVAVSRATADGAAEKGYRPETLWSVLNSIDVNRWDATADGSAVRREFDLDDVPVISIVSRLFPSKGHDLLLQALAKVKENGQPFKLLLVGEDDRTATPGGGSYSAHLQGAVDNLGLHDDIIFTGYRSDVQEILAATDIYAMPSFGEPFGVVYLEAMAMRKPVVALRSGGVPQVVEDGLSGLLSEPDDACALSANLLRLLADPFLCQQMGAYGRSRVEGYFTPKRLAEETEEIYRMLVFGEHDRRLAVSA